MAVEFWLKILLHSEQLELRDRDYAQQKDQGRGDQLIHLLPHRHVVICGFAEYPKSTSCD